ncbi:1471_t:CDS:2, partial [Funneliformis geosporum]
MRRRYLNCHIQYSEYKVEQAEDEEYNSDIYDNMNDDNLIQ